MTKKKTHTDCRKLVCLLCFKKGKELRPINDLQRTKIETSVDLKGLGLEDERLPTVLCTSCRLILNDDDSSRPIHTFDYSNLVSVKPSTRQSIDCNCYLCDLCRKEPFFNLKKKNKVQISLQKVQNISPRLS